MFQTASGYGGAVYVAAGTVTLNADTVGNRRPHQSDSNCEGGHEPWVTAAASDVAGGSVTLTNDTISNNRAGSSQGSNPSAGHGGGVFIAPDAKVYFDSFTVAHMILNMHLPNIDGTYTLLP